MDLKFLGCGSGYNPGMGNTNAWFVEGGTFYLIDCGFTAFPRLVQLEEFVSSRKIVIFITHLHADHCGSLPMAVSWLFHKQGVKPLVVFPDHSICELFELSGISPNEYFLRSSLDGPLVFAQSIAVRHTKLLNCYGYLLQVGEHKIYYSGDAALIPDKVLREFKDGMIHTIYQDTTTVAHQSDSHGSLDYLDQNIAPEQRSRVVCMHYGSNFTAEIEARGYQQVRVH